MADAKRLAQRCRSLASGRCPAGVPLARGSGLPLGLATAFYGALAAIAWGWRLWIDGVAPWTSPGGTPWPLPGRVAAGLAAGLALVALSRIWTLRTPSGRALAREMVALLGPLRAPEAWLLALLSGLGEELFFRGALQPRVGWLWASLLFGAAHLAPQRGLWTWSLWALLAGGVLGGLFAGSGDLVAPALAHVVVNGLNLQWLGRRARASQPPDLPAS